MIKPDKDSVAFQNIGKRRLYGAFALVLTGLSILFLLGILQQTGRPACRHCCCSHRPEAATCPSGTTSCNLDGCHRNILSSLPSGHFLPGLSFTGFFTGEPLLAYSYLAGYDFFHPPKA